MGFKSPVVREAQLLGNQDGSGDEKKNLMDSFVWLQSKDKQCRHKHGWKPLTLSASVLFCFALASFTLAVIIEILAQQSKKNGGLALSPTLDDIPSYAKFAYLFLPTIVAVIYSLLWSWIDLDVKRIQPWLEMSRPEGATAMRSIFLDYPYDFVAFAPIKAARRRHWAVFYSGLVMVIIFWLITPLQSAILGSGPVNVRREVIVSSSQATLPGSEQVYSMDQSILNEGYAITWLKQSLPPFTTSEYTLLPFAVESDTSQARLTNWTGSTVKYWTELECWPAASFYNKPDYDFLDGRGCNASEVPALNVNPVPGAPFKMQYFGYHPSDWADYWLSMACSKSTIHQFLAVWARYETEREVVGAFCETNYFKQQVNATVSASTKEPVEGSVVPTGPREKLLPTEFNSSSFEHLLGAGVSPVEISVQRDLPFNHLLEQHYQIGHFGLDWPSSPLVGFAIGLAWKTHNITTLDVFRNETLMGQAYNMTHQLLFSLAFRRMLNASEESTTPGTMEFEQYGIIVSRLYSAVVEGLLAVVGLFSVLLWWHGKRAPSRLSMDPASLGSLISICQNSSVLLDKFTGMGCFTDEKLRDSFDGTMLYLSCGCQSRSGQTVIQVVDSRAEFVESQRISLPDADSAYSMGHYSPYKPLALRREVGAAVTLSMVGAVVALVYLKMVERRIDGLLRPTTNFEVLQILENYIPTIFATLLEPFWVLVNRLLCILQPFRDLWSGQRPGKGSINSRYTSVPPQFVLWRAAKSGHIVLVAICLVALLSNLLAVGLGGLFNERPITVNTSCDFRQRMKPTFNNDSILSHESWRFFSANVITYEVPFWIAMNNLSQGTPLPPWVNHEYYFQPFSAISDELSRTESFTARTRGFGVVPSCSAMDMMKSKVFAPVMNYTIAREGVSNCSSTIQMDELNLDRTLYPVDPFGPSTAEAVKVFSGQGPLSPCQVPLVFSWFRSPDIRRKNESTMETWSIVCEPIFTTSMFDVTVDTDGYVLNAVQASEPSTRLDDPLTTNNTDVISIYLNNLVRDNARIHWHNNTYASDWMNYLLKIRPETADILQPLSTPNTTALLPPIEFTYRQLYALLLSQKPEWFNNFTEPVTITGTRRSSDTRIFMDDVALAISVTVLGLNIIVAIALYGGSINHFLPRLPTTIGSLLAYVAPSRMLREYDGPNSLEATTFSFGRYVGDDGHAHVGIEMDPFVVRVKLSALKKGDTEPRTGLARRVLGRRKPRRGDTWL
ncbi:hypothetical protein CkaCkLH20_01221 [Colletotrichum karsti]|uniref:Uncharacterized protein n=1 Tax=Colletotrichum karsti TaxID=1095194 RepID=A0A9P6LQ08_9PEZI|nr:uncharacterized protein CkaCkLH20_01221 [Colletotrichum karsti]KAF9881071.1 hypothetical protein CkaCkLH20_01221 [Colletotrichum karsti]